MIIGNTCIHLIRTRSLVIVFILSLTKIYAQTAEIIIYTIAPFTLSMSDQMYMASTMGQLASETLISENGTITQGFHQPYLLSNEATILSADLSKDQDILCYPNPTPGILHIQLSNVLLTEGLTYEIRDLQGKIMLKDHLDKNEINLTKLQSGPYLLLFRDVENQQYGHLKIFKN